MSFILDALKKSETERQRQASAEFATVPASSADPRVPRWLWVFGLLLAVNLAVLLGLFLRSSEQPAVIPVPVVEAAGTPAAQRSFADEVQAARRNAPPRQEETVESTAANEQPATAPGPQVPAERPAPSAVNALTLPTFQEVVANGSVVLPDLHLDIHVYSDVPDDRFVFINMSKQREQSRLGEGPLVEEITPDGVVLEYRGTTFLLPRD